MKGVGDKNVDEEKKEKEKSWETVFTSTLVPTISIS